MGTDARGAHGSRSGRQARLFKLLRRALAGAAGMRSKHGANLALDILEANGIHEIALTRADGRLLHISTRDKVIASEVIRSGSFARENMEAFVGLLVANGLDPAALTFVNIGANIGTACLNAYDCGFRRFVAVEPEPENFSLLERNLAGLERASVRCEQAAIGEVRGRATLHRHAANLGSHSLLAPGMDRTNASAIEVPVEPLSAVVEPGDRFVLFVDVEGYEPQVLRGGAAEIESGCAAIVLEITPGRYAPADAADLQMRTAAFASTFSLLPSRQAYPSGHLPALMASHARGHFDIALVRSDLSTRT
ncbi:MAG: FkbM family methyltransferase [Hyphomicrobiaceae bacterium]